MPFFPFVLCGIVCWHLDLICYAHICAYACFFSCHRMRIQKQPSRGFLRKRCSENMQQICRRTPIPKCDFNKVEIALWYGFSSVHLLYIFRTPFPKNTSRRLFLRIDRSSPFNLGLALFFMTTIFRLDVFWILRFLILFENH